MSRIPNTVELESWSETEVDRFVAMLGAHHPEWWQAITPDEQLRCGVRCTLLRCFGREKGSVHDTAGFLRELAERVAAAPPWRSVEHEAV